MNIRDIGTKLHEAGLRNLYTKVAAADYWMPACAAEATYVVTSRGSESCADLEAIVRAAGFTVVRSFVQGLEQGRNNDAVCLFNV